MSENLKSVCGIVSEEPAKPGTKAKPVIKKVSLVKKKRPQVDKYLTESSSRGTPLRDDFDRSGSKSNSASRRRQVNFNRRQVQKPSRPKKASEEYGMAKKAESSSGKNTKQSSKQGLLPEQSSLHLFEPNLMNDEDFNDLEKNCDNKKLKQSRKQATKLKKSSSMLGSKSRDKKGRSKDRLNRSFQMQRKVSGMDMKAFATQKSSAEKGPVIVPDRHNEMSFRNKNFQSNLSAMSSNSKSVRASPQVAPGKTGPARERNFTLGPMELGNKLFQNFNAEIQSKSGTDTVSQKTFLTESNNTSTNIFAQKLRERSKSGHKGSAITEIKEDVRERLETKDDLDVHNEYGIGRGKSTSAEQNLLVDSDSEKANLDSKIKKNIRNSIKEDSLFGEPFREFMETAPGAYEIKPMGPFGSEKDPNPFQKGRVFKKSKTQAKNQNSARISFEMTAEQLEKKRQEMRGNKFEIHADKTLESKSPSNRSISFENQGRKKFFIERQTEKGRKMNKSNSVVLEPSEASKHEQKKRKQSVRDRKEGGMQMAPRDKASKNVFMSSVENNLFMRQDRPRDSIDPPRKAMAPQSDKKAKNLKPVMANKSLHSNFKFGTASTPTGKLNMFGQKPKGNMAYNSHQQSFMKTIPSISGANETEKEHFSTPKIFSEFDLNRYDEKHDSIDLMDEDEEDFDLHFDPGQPLSEMKSDIITSNLQKNLNFKKEETAKNTLKKQLTKDQKHMMISREVINNSRNTKKSNTSQESGARVHINTFGKPRIKFEIPDKKRESLATEKLQNRPKQFTFNNKMVLNSFRSKNLK